jgi:hypothetical protein
MVEGATPNKPCNGWARSTLGNGRVDVKNKLKFESFPRQEENMCR